MVLSSSLKINALLVSPVEHRPSPPLPAQGRRGTTAELGKRGEHKGALPGTGCSVPLMAGGEMPGKVWVTITFGSVSLLACFVVSPVSLSFWTKGVFFTGMAHGHPPQRTCFHCRRVFRRYTCGYVPRVLMSYIVQQRWC